MNRSRNTSIPPKLWTTEEFSADILQAREIFRHQRLEEPLEEYLDTFEKARDAVENVIESTVDLKMIEDEIINILDKSDLREVFRYLAGPPISVDDLKTIADTISISKRHLQANPDLVKILIEIIMTGLDRRRFPWVKEDREPTEAEKEAAIVATAALIANQRVATSRRNESKKAQEALVRQALIDYGLTEIIIPGGKAENNSQTPSRGQFCKEITLSKRKADLVVGLWDGRIMPIECKVSNSATNSVKRLNNDAAVKAEGWYKDLGTSNVVPVAVLSGVYKLHNVEEAQSRGLTIYWAHRISDLIDWIKSTR